MGSVVEKNSSEVRKRIEKHKFENEEGEEYEKSEFNGFGDYFRRKKIKLQNLDADIRAASDKPQIFKGIVAHVTGYTQPPLHILHREIVQHGGGFLQYLDYKTMATHIIASTLPPKKAVDFGRCRIVKPAWIMDSISAGKLLAWSNYRVIDEGPGQKVLKFDSGKGLTPSSPQSKQGYREQTEGSFWANKLKAASLPGQPGSQLAEEAQTPIRAQPPNSPTTPSTNGTESLIIKAAPVPDIQKSNETPDPDQPDLTEAGLAEVKERKATVTYNAMTSEEHNAWLLSDPRLRKSSTANPDFLKQFYSESRLHHLSTWKSELKSKMQRLAAERGPKEPKPKRKTGARCYILHVDFDSFFCTVSLKCHPEYTNKPAVVAHSTGSGSEIASCNYPAREYGIKNGMWMKRALELYPDVKVLPYDFPAYEDASRLFYESILDIGGIVQSVSVDEALIDVSSIVLTNAGSQGTEAEDGSIQKEQDFADEIAQSIRKAIKLKTGCDVSVGIGGNILQAKVALRKAKPAGQYQLKSEEVLDMIGELKVEQLPGVARSISRKLEEIGVTTVNDIRHSSKERLLSALGPKTSEKLRDYARGIDQTEVGEQPPRKSVSAEVNWGIRFINQPEAEEFLYNLSKELEKRLLNEQVKGKQLTMKIMRRSVDAPLDPAKHLGHGKCDTFNKSVAFGVATHDYQIIGREAVSILRSFKFSPGDLRGLGLQMTKLEPIKTNNSAPEGSQRKLAFPAFLRASPARNASKLELVDNIGNIKNPRGTPNKEIDQDPITDDPLTPPKSKFHPAMAISKARQDDTKATTPLNVSGTQFIIPSNPDPAILAELPSDIRTKLIVQKPKLAKTRAESPFTETKSESPMPGNGLPTQVDPEVFNALPDEMKAEILATYGRNSVQTTPNTSPRKNRSTRPKKPTTPTKRGGVRDILGQTQRQKDAQSGFSQPNLQAPESKEYVMYAEELDSDFLSNLPEDMRMEVIADHRQRQLAKQPGPEVPIKKRQGVDPDSVLEGGQLKIPFTPLPPKISFPGSGITSTQELKDMLEAWHSGTAREGPHRRDVEVLERFLVQVIREERESVKGKAQKAVRQRGLAPLNI